jgi:hypothetical protein
MVPFGDPVALGALMGNPKADTQAVRETVTEAIEDLDMEDADTIGWMLQELRDYPAFRYLIVEKN